MKDNYVSDAVDSIMIDHARGKLTQATAIDMLEGLTQLNLFDNQPIDDNAAKYIAYAIAEVRRS